MNIRSKIKSPIQLQLAILLILTLIAGSCSLVPSSTNGPQTLQITDATGHTIALSELPDRIAIAGRASVMVQDAAFMFEGAEGRVKALENRNQSVFNFLPVVDPSIGEKDLFEKGAGPEQIAAVNPDLVLMKDFNRDRLGESIEQLGIPVLYLHLEGPEVFYRDIVTLGEVFGQSKRADEIIAFYQIRVGEVEGITAAIPEEDRPRVLLLRHSAQGGEVAFSVPSSSWLQTRMVEIAGGRPIWTSLGEGGGWTVVNFEQIAAWNPDQIFIINYQGNAGEVVKWLREDPLWSGLSAVKGDQLFAFGFDYYSWDQPDPRWILGLEWLVTKIHPAEAGTIDILEEVEAFYTTLYRLDRESIQGQVIPKLKGDIP